MKKKLLLATMLVLALGATACSKKVEETTAAPEATTVAATTTAAPTVATTAEEIEEDYMTGYITKLTDTLLTIKSDDDASEKEYDISEAKLVQNFPFSVGDYVEITYPDETTKIPVPVIRVEVLESVIGANTDPSVQGTIEDGTMNTLTLKLEDGTSYTFNTGNAYMVSKNGIQIDKKATVTYIGDIDDTDPIPLAVKVVLEDSYETPEAKLSAFSGSVASIEEDFIVLESADGDFYTFSSDSIDFSSYKEDDNLKVFYTGTITAKEIPATKIVK